MAYVKDKRQPRGIRNTEYGIRHKEAEAEAPSPGLPQMHFPISTFYLFGFSFFLAHLHGAPGQVSANTHTLAHMHHCADVWKEEVSWLGGRFVANFSPIVPNAQWGILPGGHL